MSGMSDTLREDIITSAAADRMLERTSPIYDDSYIGLWMFEAIGRAYDGLWEAIDTLPEQLFPDTATWALELWERRYGITPAAGATLEERRSAVIIAWKRTVRSHDRIETWLSEQTGGTASITDYIDAFTFAIEIDCYLGLSAADLGKVIRYINRRKPSHMSYRLFFNSRRSLALYSGLALYSMEEGTFTIEGVDAQTGRWYMDEFGEMLLDENGMILMMEG